MATDLGRQETQAASEPQNLTRVLWSERALRDALRIRNYLLHHNPLAAVAVAESLIAAGNNLSRFPRRYQQRGEG